MYRTYLNLNNISVCSIRVYASMIIQGIIFIHIMSNVLVQRLADAAAAAAAAASTSDQYW